VIDSMGSYWETGIKINSVTGGELLHAGTYLEEVVVLSDHKLRRDCRSRIAHPLTLRA